MYLHRYEHAHTSLPHSDPSTWQSAMYAFLAGSDRTVTGYFGMLQQFFGQLGKTPDQATARM